MVVSSMQLLTSTQCFLPEPVPNRFTNLSSVRRDFPILTANSSTLFFDNAATSQKPLMVLEKIEEFNRHICANAGRGAYSWSTRLSREVENVRSRVADFLNSAADLVAFTSGATDSLNMVATMWGWQNLVDGDEVMLCEEDHASNVLPWFNVQELLSRRGIQIKIVPFQMHHTGTYDRKSLQAGLSARTRIVCLTHIHHLYGMEMDIAELKAFIPDNVYVSLDASQSAGHIKVDSKSLEVDFISFSGHKMFAANGIGVLWTSARALSQMWPIRVGAKTQLLKTSRFDVDRHKLSNIVECGTLNLPAVLSLGTAIDFIEHNDISAMSDYVSSLTISLLNKLKKVEGIEFAPGIGVCECTKGFGIISFKFSDVSSADVGAYLDSEEILVKTGDQCLGRRNQSDDLIRVSLQIYNTVEEIDRFAEVLSEAVSN